MALMRDQHFPLVVILLCGWLNWKDVMTSILMHNITTTMFLG